MKESKIKNVLLVDDDMVFTFLNSRILKTLSFVNDIHTAQNGKQAIDLFNTYFQNKKPIPDIVLLDLNMPVLDGFGFLEEFSRLSIPNKEQVKIIILTSSQHPSDIQRAKSYGVSQYLTKPLREESLLDALNNLG